MHNAKKSQTFTKEFKHDFPLPGVHLFSFILSTLVLICKQNKRVFVCFSMLSDVFTLLGNLFKSYKVKNFTILTTIV